MDNVEYEEKSKYDGWFIAVLAVPVAIIAITAIYVGLIGSVNAYAILILDLFIILCLWLLMPRKFCIMNNGVRVFLGGGINFSIPFRKIKQVRKMEGVSIGINFATSSKTALEIVISGGMNINIAPENRDLFVEHLNKTIDRWREHKG